MNKPLHFLIADLLRKFSAKRPAGTSIGWALECKRLVLCFLLSADCIENCRQPQAVNDDK
jgi:hypothetical protein